jgi:hypothetical protein
MYLDGASWTVLMPRPDEAARFATGVVDDSVHLLANVASLEFLAHCLWALAFQRRDRTALLFDLPMMVPNPVTSESSRPVVLVNSELGPPSPTMLDELRVLLPVSSASDGTVRLRTAGLDRALADPNAFAAKERSDTEALPWDPSQWDQWVTRQAGLVTWVAPATVLRAYAAAAAEFGAFSWESLDGTEPVGPDDVLVFDRTLLERATSLRMQRASKFPGRGLADLTGAERAQLWTTIARANSI